ncbi:Nn.00g074390.m01.CDS01 [Neocucurbitaria sp. VM-36]
MLDLATRRIICEDTIVRSKSISASTPGGSLESNFISSQLAPLSKSHTAYPDLSLNRPVKVHNSDSFALARTLRSQKGKVGVLNLGSDQEPGEGWRYTLSETQEEALCYSLTLYETLKPEWYPWPNTGPGSCIGIFSPDVVVFKDTIDNDLAEMPTHQRHVLAVITVAAPCFPQIKDDGECFANDSELQDLI